MGLRSTATTFLLLRQLEDLGYIQRDPSIPRGIRILRYYQPTLINANDVPYNF
ncbi:MAG: hypothetical protein HPY90_05740 [Syntrophothermus sp.]|uniref:hypothetical protein n=1 Tax=Syntrophothermus sp. TaxID=2736299 RepID=UPI00338F6615|nr:hypothetical protein [Syntrophothermus sp.]